LVHTGFLTLEGIVEAEISDLTETTGLDEDVVSAIKKAAADAVAQIPEPQPATVE
jgi:transcription termination factor NusA